MLRIKIGIPMKVVIQIISVCLFIRIHTSEAQFSAPSVNWKPVNIQGLGFVTGVLVHPNTVSAPNLVYVM